MKFQITPNQNFCSFDDGIVYSFNTHNPSSKKCECLQCAFFGLSPHSLERNKCRSVPCQKMERLDKKDGFWQISKAIDYQTFTKMLQTGG